MAVLYTFDDLYGKTLGDHDVPGVQFISNVYVTSDGAHDYDEYPGGENAVLSGVPTFVGPVEFTLSTATSLTFTMGYLDNLGSIRVRAWKTFSPDHSATPDFSYISDFFGVKKIVIAPKVRHVLIGNTSTLDSAGFSIDNLWLGTIRSGILKVKIQGSAEDGLPDKWVRMSRRGIR